MLRSSSLLRHAARLALLLPFAVAAQACGDDDDSSVSINPGGTDGGAKADATPSGDASKNDGSSNADGSSNSDGGVDVTAPTVLTSFPAEAATTASITDSITATFSEAMSPGTLSDTSFTVMQGTTKVLGTVSYVDNTVSFDPDSELALGTTYKATISTAAKDLAGNALAVAHSWTFKTNTMPRVGPAPVLLGKAGNYVIVATSAITNVPTSVVNGNIAISPAAASYITGFTMTRVGTYWTAPEVKGGIFAANNDPPTPTNLTTVIGNMEAAYTDAATRPTPDYLNEGAGSIGGLTLLPGLYKWTSGVNVATDITLSGAPNDVWIFQVSGDLTMAAAKKMTMIGGGRAKNVFWQVTGVVSLGTTAHAEGIMLSQTAITLEGGSTIKGRLLAQTAVSIANSTIVAP